MFYDGSWQPGITSHWPEEIAIEEGAIAMSAVLHRNHARSSARPQVGRFYGDFLCMASFRKNGGPLALMRRPRKFSFEIKRLSLDFRRGLGSQTAEIAGEFQVEVSQNAPAGRL